ncbi:threonylcarbamoyl-AMP synthase, partial [Candidatus Shapirobacteria bacterium]|nr:threonylcarbamoyl-AMP synthase [Candidatus Shapirobacteria bacterium]
MKISKIRDKDKAMRAAIRTLKTGGLVIYPTETCYGLGVDATNKQAV